jgi:DNA-binding transcriptional ArsR family regulator
LSAGRDRFVAISLVQDALARWAAPLPRTRQPDDAQRRGALALACALAEQQLAASAADHWGAGERGVVEQVAVLAELSGLTRQQTEGALATLVAAACVERITVGGERRLRLVDALLVEEPALARVDWAGARARLRGVGASVLPAQAVLRSIARQSGAVPPGAAAPVVACTQESLALETLLGRTAVVAALRALGEADLVERAARRGTWTECRLLPAAFGEPAAERGPGARPLVADREVPLAHALDERAAPRPPAPDAGAPIASAAPAPPERAAAGPGGAMALEVGGVRVPLAPGMTVEPPPGATITIEVDAAGRRFVRLGAGLRLGPID